MSFNIILYERTYWKGKLAIHSGNPTFLQETPKQLIYCNVFSPNFQLRLFKLLQTILCTFMYWILCRFMYWFTSMHFPEIQTNFTLILFQTRAMLWVAWSFRQFGMSKYYYVRTCKARTNAGEISRRACCAAGCAADFVRSQKPNAVITCKARRWGCPGNKRAFEERLLGVRIASRTSMRVHSMRDYFPDKTLQTFYLSFRLQDYSES